MSPSVSTMKRLKVYCDGLNIEFDNVENAWLEKMLDHDDKKKQKSYIQIHEVMTLIEELVKQISMFEKLLEFKREGARIVS